METTTSPVVAVAVADVPPPAAAPIASPIVVPRISELMAESAASSPAITTSANGLAPPSHSPLPPSSNDTIHKAKAVTTKSQAGMNGGRWTEQEHQSFLAGLRLYGREWKKVASKIKTRTSAQIRSHAQKYFAKLARDDETRKLGTSGLLPPHADSAFGGYMSDDGSSTTAGNGSGDEAADDTDSNASQHRSSSAPATTVVLSTPSHRAILPVHPFPSPIKILGPPTPGGLSINALFHGRGAPLLVAASNTNTKKRSRPSASTPPLSCKQRKCDDSDPFYRLPSPEELVETVSPTVRQRLSSLIDAEISALQVLSCITWLQQQHQQGDLKVHLQAPPPSSSSATPNATTGVFSATTLAMFSPERSPSIFKV